MGKSVTATLLGVLIKQGVYDLSAAGAHSRVARRRAIRARRSASPTSCSMSSGLRIRAPQDPDYDPPGPYPDHVYLYTGSVDSFHYAATRPLQWPPGTVGRYRNTDPVLVNYLVRLGVEKRGEEYLSFPQRALFDKHRHPDDGAGDGSRTETSSRRATSSRRRATGRASAISICRTACGTASGSCPRDTSSS